MNAEIETAYVLLEADALLACRSVFCQASIDALHRDGDVVYFSAITSGTVRATGQSYGSGSILG